MKTFAITAGHGAGDPGACADGFIERDLMTELRDLTADCLRKMGHTVLEDGDQGENLPLFEAIKLVKQVDVGIELHTNAVENLQANGVEVISQPKDKALSQAVAKAIADVLGARLRGDAGWIDQSKSARGRLGFVNAGGLIVEVFFISNPQERQKYLDRKAAVAIAIAETLST